MPVSKDARNLNRRKLRYRLYRIRSGDSVDPKDGLKAHFESQDNFDGWHNFGITWDVGSEDEWPEGHYVAILLKESLDVTWQRTLLGLAQDPPGFETEDSANEGKDEA